MAAHNIPTPPDDKDPAVRVWRYEVSQLFGRFQEDLETTAAGAVFSPATTATWSGWTGPHYPLVAFPFASRSTSRPGYSWCLESTTPALIIACNADDKVLVCERTYDRWRVRPAAETSFAGPQEISVTNPTDSVYIPMAAGGGGTRTGKFWVASDASDTITTIDPHNSFATSTFTLGASESNVSRLVYDTYRQVVWAVTGGGTRICKIDPTDGSNDGQSTGWTGLMQVEPSTTKIWLVKTSGLITERVQYLDPSSLAATNSGLTMAAAGAAWGLKYLPEVDQVLVIEGGGNNSLHAVSNSSAALVATLVAVNNWCVTCAWIAESRLIVLGGLSEVHAIDLYSGVSTHFADDSYSVANLGNNNYVDCKYIPEYKEVLMQNEWYLHVFPTPAYIAVQE